VFDESFKVLPMHFGNAHSSYNAGAQLVSITF